MYAVIETGGKQFRVQEGSRIQVERLKAVPESDISLDRVLLLGGDGEECRIGTPYVDGASVTAEVTEQGRGPKIKVFKRWRRNDSRKMRGHRQEYTSLLIRSINPTPDAVGRGVAETSAEG